MINFISYAFVIYKSPTTVSQLFVIDGGLAISSNVRLLYSEWILISCYHDNDHFFLCGPILKCRAWHILDKCLLPLKKIKHLQCHHYTSQHLKPNTKQVKKQTSTNCKV